MEAKFRVVHPAEVREVVGHFVQAKDPDEFSRVLSAVQVLCDVLAEKGIFFATVAPSITE